MIKPTTRQHEILDYIRSYIAHNGYSPAHSDINKHFNWTSANASKSHIDALAKKGLLTYAPNVARSIKLIENKSIKVN